MQLQLHGVVETGVSLLNSGITDLEVAVIDGVTHLYASTGRNGGIAEYVVGGDGQVALNTSVIFPANIAGSVSDRLVIVDDGSGPALMIGTRATGLIAYDLNPGGGIGSQTTISWSAVNSGAAQGSAGYLQALVTMSDGSIALFPDDFRAEQVVDLASATVNGREYVLTANAETNEVATYRIDPATGQMVEVSTMGAAEGLGIDAPTAMEVVTVGGTTYVLLAAANTSSLSVMRLTGSGDLVPTDHVVDNGGTRFDGVQAMDVVQAGEHTFVVAGGADNGITVFELLPDGRLVALATLADDDHTAMHRVTAISVAVSGDTMNIFVGSQNDSGVTQFTLDMSTLGAVEQGTAAVETLTGTARDDVLLGQGQGDTLVGGGGDDILVSGDGGTVMRGGAGNDIFVIREGSGATTIADFDRGGDRLDLSDLPMLRDVSQLKFTTTSTGCVIEYRGHCITITASNGQPLSVADVFPDGFDGGDHFDYYPPEELRPADPGLFLEGGDYRDTLSGGMHDDTLLGGAGRDVLNGFGGNDYLDGGAGRDLIQASDGNNTLVGGLGADTIYGGTGDNSVIGGDGRDALYAGAGDDTIYGGVGNDTLGGGAGNDYLVDTDGKNIFFLGDGDDTAVGGDGNDQMYGGKGNDLIDAGGGNNSLGGGLGNDTIHGGDGNDALFGKNGNDVLDGGAGNDTIWGNNDSDTLLGGDGSDWLNGGDGNDYVDGGSGNDQLYGKTGNDLLDGGSGIDAIWGDEGNDTVLGGWGDDWLSGGAGDDIVNGGPGNDTLRGGSGNDVFWGGAGADVFEFFRDHDTGTIMDFNPDEGDVIQLDDWIWFSLGDLSAEEVVDRFGSIDANGNVVLDFSDVGGNVVVLDGFHDLAALPDHIHIM